MAPDKNSRKFERPHGGCIAAVATIAALAALWPGDAGAAPKPADPLLVPVKRAHCHQMYGIVEKRLKGRGNDVVSTVTRNGLKDFFVRRPGKIDCTGNREIPWRDDKDRDFIASVVAATGAALKSKVDMTKDYGVGPAPQPSR